MTKSRGTTPAIDTNAPRNPDGSLGVSAQTLSPQEAAQAAEHRANASAGDALLDAVNDLRTADSLREVPRARTDNLNPRMARRLPPDNAVRTSLSSRAKKRLSKQKNTWLTKAPKGQRVLLHGLVTDPAGAQRLEFLNRSLAAVHGQRSELPPNTKEVVSRLDRLISAYERDNESLNTIYTKATPPPGWTNNQFANRMQELANQNGQLHWDRYVLADHSLTQIPVHNDDELVYEYETSRGAYLGKSDSNPNGMHLVARGNRVDVVGVKTVQVRDNDGNTVTRRVIQIRDAERNERTQAND